MLIVQQQHSQVMHTYFNMLICTKARRTQPMEWCPQSTSVYTPMCKSASQSKHRTRNYSCFQACANSGDIWRGDLCLKLNQNAISCFNLSDCSRKKQPWTRMMYKAWNGSLLKDIYAVHCNSFRSIGDETALKQLTSGNNTLSRKGPFSMISNRFAIRYLWYSLSFYKGE